MSSLMDPAQQSLAEALRITYRLVQFAMVVLAVLFVFSGMQSVREGERGVRLVFGKVAADDLSPGFHFSLPVPLGELVKVRTGTETIRLHEEFWPKLREEQKSQTLEELAGSMRGSLNPAEDGSVLTGDGNIAHMKWTVTYTRADPVRFAQSVDPEFESKLVRAAVMRGVVRAAAQISIDDLLRSAGEGVAARAAEQTARSVAQGMLDQVGTGIQIEQIVLEERIPPLSQYEKFSAVQNAESSAGKAVSDAEGDRRTRLTAAAGEAAETLLALIGRYEREVETASAGSEKTLGAIHALMLGERPDVDGRATDVRVAGRVASLLDEARAYRSIVATNARSEADRLSTKLQAFRSNPRVLLTGEWADALAEFREGETVQVWFLPPGVRTLELLLNRDPEIAREQERQRNLKAGREAEEKRREQRRRQEIEKVDQGQVKTIGQ